MSNHEFTKAKLYKPTPNIMQTPQDHLSVDLIGPYNTTTQGNIYASTACCNLTGYLMTTPIPDKKTSTIAVQLFLEIFLKFGFPRILHSNNRTEFKSKLSEHLMLTTRFQENLHLPLPSPVKWKIKSITSINKGLYT